MLFELADRLQDSNLINVLTSTGWLAALIAILHYYSMFVLVGSMTIVDLSVLGVVGGEKGAVPIARRTLPWVWAALPVNLLSGFVMFAADATAYVTAWSFWLKIVIVMLAIALSIVVQKKVPAVETPISNSGSLKALAVISIVLWIGAILMGTEVPAISHIG
jgi:hypothetical protein